MAAPRKSLILRLIYKRQFTGENQSTFWNRFGVTQSGGSRYESGRAIPAPTQMLCQLWLSNVLSDEDLKKVRPK